MVEEEREGGDGGDGVDAHDIGSPKLRMSLDFCAAVADAPSDGG